MFILWNVGKTVVYCRRWWWKATLQNRTTKQQWCYVVSCPVFRNSFYSFMKFTSFVMTAVANLIYLLLININDILPSAVWPWVTLNILSFTFFIYWVYFIISFLVSGYGLLCWWRLANSAQQIWRQIARRYGSILLGGDGDSNRLSASAALRAQVSEVFFCGLTW